MLADCTAERRWAIVTPQRQNPLSGLEPRFQQGAWLPSRLLCAGTATSVKQWWAGQGHRKMRRILCWPVVPTLPSSPPIKRLEPQGGEFKNSYREVVIMDLTTKRLSLFTSNIIVIPTPVSSSAPLLPEVRYVRWHPCEVEELIDHYRALIYAIVTLDRADAKEVLSLILWQQIDALHSTYLRDSEEPLEVVYAL